MAKVKYTQKSLAALKKGETFSVLSFTGMNLGVFEVIAASKTQIKTVTKKGAELIFNRKDGTQSNTVEGKERYANLAVDELEASAPKAKAKAKTKAVKVEELVEDDELETEPKSAKAKAKPAKSAKGKVVKKAPVEDEFDDDVDFDDDDDDWEDA